MSTTPKVGRGWHANTVYAAEADVRRMKRNGDRDLTPAEARTFFDSVVGAEGQRDARGLPHLEFFSSVGSGSGWAYYKTGRVRLNRRGLTASTVLHELAHVYCPEDRGHGKAFRAEYLRLAGLYLPTFAVRLRNALRRRGVAA